MAKLGSWIMRTLALTIATRPSRAMSTRGIIFDPRLRGLSVTAPLRNSRSNLDRSAENVISIQLIQCPAGFG